MVRVGNPGRSPTVGRSIGAAFLLLSLGLLASCNSATMSSGDSPDIDVLDKVRSLDILPRQPQQVNAAEASARQRSRRVIYEGAEVPGVSEARPPQSAATGNRYELNFENTPVANVAKVVLGDILGTGYTIDPRVQGTISLVSGRPVAKSDILFVLEDALRLSGVVLVHDTAGYRLTPIGDAVGTGRIDAADASPEPGYRVSVLRLQHGSSQTLLKLLDSFATKAGMVRADSTRNLLLIQGSGAERRTAVDTALSFDLDWMRGQSVGIFPIVNSGPEPIIAELEKIVDSGENGLSQNVINFRPISRLNAILVVSKKPVLLRTAATWIKRLDHADSARTSVHVYRVKYGEARQIARVLSDMFIGGSSSGLLDSAENQLAPGSGTSATASSDRLSQNNNSSSSSGFGSRSQSGTSTNGTSGFGGQTAAASAGANTSGTGSLDSRSTGAGGPPLLPGGRITADAVNNTLLIYADQGNYRIIEATLQQVDQPQLQVAIDATIAEVTLNDELSYGVQTPPAEPQSGIRDGQGLLPQHPVDFCAGRHHGGGRRNGRQRLYQSRIAGIQFPSRIGLTAERNSGRSAYRHRCQSVVQPVPGCGQQSGSNTSSWRRRASLHRQRYGADGEQHDRQHDRLSQHRYHSAGFSPHQRQRKCQARRRTNNQQRFAGNRREFDSDCLRTKGQELDFGSDRPDGPFGRIDQ